MSKSRQVRNLERIKNADSENRQAAEIILADPEKYDGLPLLWANLWMSNHAQRKIALPKKKIVKTVEERLAEHESKQRTKRIGKRRALWSNRKWKSSRKGNLFLRINGFILVIFARYGQFSIGVADKKCKQEMVFMTKLSMTVEEAKEDAFNALLYGESRRQHNLLVMARKGVGV